MRCYSADVDLTDSSMDFTVRDWIIEGTQIDEILDERTVILYYIALKLPTNPVAKHISEIYASIGKHVIIIVPLPFPKTRGISDARLGMSS